MGRSGLCPPAFPPSLYLLFIYHTPGLCYIMDPVEYETGYFSRKEVFPDGEEKRRYNQKTEKRN